MAMAALWEASDAHAVLVFRNQWLTDAQQVAFAENFGRPGRYVLSYRNDIKLRLDKPEMVDVSNLDAATGEPAAGATRHRMVNLGNRLWHTDSSFKLPRGGFSLLYAHAVPPAGPLGAGETEFADTCAAYEALSSERQAMLEDMRAEHSLMHSRAVLGFTDFAAEERAALPPVVQPLVNTHPRTGRKSIYVASHASHIIDMELAEGRLMLIGADRTGCPIRNPLSATSGEKATRCFGITGASPASRAPLRRALSPRPAARHNIGW